MIAISLILVYVVIGGLIGRFFKKNYYKYAKITSEEKYLELIFIVTFWPIIVPIIFILWLICALGVYNDR